MAQTLYLVTGAMGHLGNVLIGKLIRQGKQVRGLALPGDNAVRFEGKIDLVRGDVCDVKSLEPFFRNPDGKELVVIHTAGIVSIASRHSQKVYDVNVQGTKNIVDQCIAHGVKKLIYVSSVHAIPEPSRGEAVYEVSHFSPDKVHGYYAKTKAEATQYVLDHAAHGEESVPGKLQACVVHPSGIIGPGDPGHGHLTQMIVDYLTGALKACVKGGYDFVDVRDVAAGILSCVENGVSGECYILSGHFCEIPVLLEKVHEISGRKEMRAVLPYWLAKSTAPLSEIYYKLKHQPPLYTSYSLKTLRSNAAFSCQKARDTLKYVPRLIDTTLADTVRWIRNCKKVAVKPEKRRKNLKPGRISQPAGV